MIEKKRLASFFLMVSLLYSLGKYFDLGNIETVLYFIGAIIISRLIPFNDDRNINKRYYLLWSFIPLLLMTAYMGIFLIFGDFDFGAVLYHMEMGVDGGRPTVQGNRVVFLVLSFLSFLIPMLFFKRHDKRFKTLDPLIAVILLILNPFFWNVYDFYYGRKDQTLFENYVQPPLQFANGVNKKNIIIIYAESTERTFAEIEHGEEIFAEFLELAATGIEAQGLRQVTNTGWTMAGFMTSQCGVPLQPRGLYRGNNFSRHKDFFTGIYCLPDILSANGYHTEYMNGGGRNFAGLGAYLDDHHFNRTTHFDNYEKLAGDYTSYWGLYDDTLLDLAEKRIEELHQEEQPFAFFMATIGGHASSGFPTRTCKKNIEQGNLSGMQFAIKCSGYHIQKTIETLRAKGLLENTIVVVHNDHLIMDNPHSDELNQFNRMDYFTVVGDGIEPRVIKREAAMFDLFPTILELLGMNLPDGRAGVGRSLFNGNKNMMEELGPDKLNEVIRKDRSLRQKMWNEKRPEL
ncbi:sulfatase-like hydrolase/transferase [Paenochrobactrum sp. BZR 588]|uniref:sulfatase-like hydrolase/transferase n=1 Tax=unclassified Paenochrobactrum TaxID=2639760 RepID=UPI003855440F